MTEQSKAVAQAGAGPAPSPALLALADRWMAEADALPGSAAFDLAEMITRRHANELYEALAAEALAGRPAALPDRWQRLDELSKRILAGNPTDIIGRELADGIQQLLVLAGRPASPPAPATTSTEGLSK